jgi:hypothetical protein
MSPHHSRTYPQEQIHRRPWSLIAVAMAMRTTSSISQGEAFFIVGMVVGMIDESFPARAAYPVLTPPWGLVGVQSKRELSDHFVR